jgi:hypothetical protein
MDLSGDHALHLPGSQPPSHPPQRRGCTNAVTRFVRLRAGLDPRCQPGSTGEPPRRIHPSEAVAPRPADPASVSASRSWPPPPASAAGDISGATNPSPSAAVRSPAAAGLARSSGPSERNRIRSDRARCSSAGTVREAVAEPPRRREVGCERCSSGRTGVRRCWSGGRRLSRTRVRAGPDRGPRGEREPDRLEGVHRSPFRWPADDRHGLPRL